MNKKYIENFFIFSSIVSVLSGAYTLYDAYPKIAADSTLETQIIRVSIIVIVTGCLLFSYSLYNKLKNPFSFEILDELIELKINDKSGKDVSYKKTTTLKCLKPDSYFFYNNLSADGDIKNIQVENGAIDNITKNHKGEYLVSTKLSKVLKKGESTTRSIKCKYIDSFTSDKEFWISRRNYPGANMKIEITFPAGRFPKTFSSHYRNGLTESLAKQQPIQEITNNTVKLVLDLNKSTKLYAAYIIRWEW